MTKIFTLICFLVLLILRSISFGADISNLNSVIIDYNTSGDKTLVTGTVGQSIRAYRLLIFCNGDNSIVLKSSNGTVYLPTVSLVSNQGIVLDSTSPTIPWFTFAIGTNAVLNLSSNQQCSGRFYYIKE